MSPLSIETIPSDKDLRFLRKRTPRKIDMDLNAHGGTREVAEVLGIPLSGVVDKVIQTPRSVDVHLISPRRESSSQVEVVCEHEPETRTPIRGGVVTLTEKSGALEIFPDNGEKIGYRLKYST